MSRVPFGLDLFPSCLKVSSLKDKVNTVSGAVLKAGIVGWWEMGECMWSSFEIKKSTPETKAVGIRMLFVH